MSGRGQSRRGGSGNRGGGGGGRRSKKSAGGKELSKAALRSIVKNEETAEEYLSALERGEHPPSFSLAKVTKALGGGRFEVTSPETGPVRATLEGLFVGRGDFWKNPEVSTAVRPGGYVVVEDVGLGHMAAGGHHRIVAILSREQARRGLRMLGRRASSHRSSSGSMGVLEFNREQQEAEEAAERAQAVAAAAAALESLRRSRGAAARRRTSSGKTARSSETNVSSNLNWAALSDEKKAAAKQAKLTRRKERRRAKKAAGGGSAWSWFSF